MRHRLVLLPVLLATLVCAPPALAWTWPQDGPVLQPFVLGGDPYAAGQHRGIDVAGPPGAAVRAPTSGTVSFAGFVPSGGRTVTIQTADGLAVTLASPGLPRRCARRDRRRGRHRRGSGARWRRRPSGAVRADGRARGRRSAGLPGSARVPSGAGSGGGAARRRSRSRPPIPSPRFQPNPSRRPTRSRRRPIHRSRQASRSSPIPRAARLFPCTAAARPWRRRPPRSNRRSEPESGSERRPFGSRRGRVDGVDRSGPGGRGRAHRHLAGRLTRIRRRSRWNRSRLR